MKKLENFNVEEVLKELYKRREYFYSEADFKFNLAWTIKEYFVTNPNIEIKLEYTNNKLQETNKYMYIDIAICEESKIIPIELKYKTTRCKEDVIIKNHGAKNLGCYKYLNDINRIETVKEKYKGDFVKGYAIMLTNDKSYLKKPRIQNGRIPYYANFSIHNGRDVNCIVDENKSNNEIVYKPGKELKWGKGCGEEHSEKYKKGIKLKERYKKLQWKQYSDKLENIDEKLKGKFFLLNVEVEG